MLRSTLSLAVVASAIAIVNARPAYVARIPNGANVSGVAALGHVNPAGGGATNDFGSDFATTGEKWTTEFCHKDSDGDGQTNGQELGDPCCVWVKDTNAVVRWTTGVSHPGDPTKKSDPSLWANITCDASTSNSTSSTAGSIVGTVNAGDDKSNTTTTDAGSTTKEPTTSAPGKAANSSSSTSSAVTPAMYSAAGIVAAVMTYFL